MSRDEFPAEYALRPRGEKAPRPTLRGEAIPDEVRKISARVTRRGAGCSPEGRAGLQRLIRQHGGIVYTVVLPSLLPFFFFFIFFVPFLVCLFLWCFFFFFLMGRSIAI